MRRSLSRGFLPALLIVSIECLRIHCSCDLAAWHLNDTGSDQRPNPTYEPALQVSRYYVQPVIVLPSSRSNIVYYLVSLQTLIVAQLWISGTAASKIRKHNTNSFQPNAA